jgi:glycosyltransferase involved in cell wall biosynthesis
MRILIPITFFDRAGGFRVLSELANHWSAAGHPVDFLVDARSGPPYFPTRAGIRRFDLAGREVAGAAERPMFAPRGNQASILRTLHRGLGRIGADYDVILANHSLTTWPVAFARTGAARRFYYVQAYEQEYYALKPGASAWITGVLARLSYRLPLTQVANAPIYVGHPEIRAREWVPPGMDMTHFRRRAQPPRFDGGRPVVIGTIGRSEPTKGTSDVLAAFERLVAAGRDVRLSVAFGNLPQGWAHPRAEVAPIQGDAALAEWYRSLDVLVAPGTVQLGACHYPVLEAMACGTPVVTTGYLPADEGNAWLVPVHDPAAIAAAVESIAGLDASRRQAMLDEAWRAVQAFAWPRVAADFLRLFEDVPAARRVPA